MLRARCISAETTLVRDARRCTKSHSVTDSESGVWFWRRRRRRWRSASRFTATRRWEGRAKGEGRFRQGRETRARGRGGDAIARRRNPFSLRPSPTPPHRHHHRPSRHHQRAPPTPPGRRHARLLALPSTPYTPPRATSPLHARASLPFFWSRTGVVLDTIFSPISAPSIKIGGGGSKPFFSACPVHHRFPTGPVVRRHDRRVEITGRLFLAKRVGEKNDANIMSRSSGRQRVNTPRPLWRGRRHAGTLSTLTSSLRGNVCEKKSSKHVPICSVGVGNFGQYFMILSFARKPLLPVVFTRRAIFAESTFGRNEMKAKRRLCK